MAEPDEQIAEQQDMTSLARRLATFLPLHTEAIFQPEPGEHTSGSDEAWGPGRLGHVELIARSQRLFWSLLPDEDEDTPGAKPVDSGPMHGFRVLSWEDAESGALIIRARTGGYLKLSHIA